MRGIIHSQRGDTIVEVMLAIVIVGMVVVSSYSTSARALRTGRFAQEQTEALKVAESQIEKIKYVAGLDASVTPPNVFDASQPARKVFCIDDSIPFKKILLSDPGYNAACTKLSGLYTVLVTYDDTAEDIFKVKVTWERQATDQLGTVQVAYKLHK